MKKFIAIALALVMAFSATLAVSAAGISLDNGAQSTSPMDIKVTINGNIVHRYAFEVEYGALSYTCNVNLTWDTETYTYKQSTTGWTPSSEGADKITIYNHSDAPIKYSVTASTSGEKYGNFALNVENGSGQIRGCTEVDTMNSVFQTVTIGVSGDPTVRSGSNLTIGSVTVSASKA